MSITSAPAQWLLLVFSLPVTRTSQRVEVWRKLRRYGALGLRSSGYVLPNSPVNQERFEWLASTIRSYKGQASVIQAQAFDDLPPEKLKDLFVEARSRDYRMLLKETQKYLAISRERRPRARLSRIRRRLSEIQEIDFFQSPTRMKLENLLAQADESEGGEPSGGRKLKGRKYSNRLWITRPRPGIDRVSSAWLIRQFIDPKARFVFDLDPDTRPDAIPFDMYCESGFGHRGESCTFETLCKEFGIRDGRIKRIAQIVHDADLGDGKFGRAEGHALDKVLGGWAKQELSDDELLQRGMDLIEGLYESMA